jgi:hypothetical protein
MPGPHVIVPTAAYSIEQARAALGLKKTSIRREVREGRLRVSVRAGRRYLLGAWLLQWIEEGELHQQQRPEMSGASGAQRNGG